MSTPDANGWLDIKTAPRDGTRVLICRIPRPQTKRQVVIAKWKGRYWDFDDRKSAAFDTDLIGWRPLPQGEALP